MKHDVVHKAVRTAVGVAAVFALMSCDHKELCFDHGAHSPSVKVSVLTDWEREWERTYDYDWKTNWNSAWGYTYDELRPSARSGIRATVYREGEYPSENNLPAEGGMLPLREGKSALLFYNNDTEYIVFSDLGKVASARATTRTLARGGFKAMHVGERTVDQPDQLYGHYIESYTAIPGLEVVTLPVTMRPLTYTYLIRYEFSHGLQYVALARGAIAGMAESVYLTDGHTGDEAATVMYDCTLKPFGAEAVVKSFGVPSYPGDHYVRASEPEGKFMINLQVRLTNGEYKNFEFDVTRQVEGQPRGGVITISGIEITDEEGMSGSGAFNPDVEGWGEWEDIELPLN